MSYSPSQPFVFFHLPKTGGTTVREVLYRHMHPKRDEVFYPCKVQSCITELTTRFENAVRGKVAGTHVLPHYAFILGHCDRTSVLRRISFERGTNVTTLNGIDCMTIVRNPFHRMLSHYYMFLHYSEKMPFHKFASTRSAQEVADLLEGNMQTQRLGPTLAEAIDTVDRCETGIFEYMDDFIQKLNRSRGISSHHMHLNKARVNPSPEDLKYEPAFRSILKDDYTLWHHARNKSLRSS